MGLNYGNKYTYSHNTREAKKEKEGVFFNELSKKWTVNVENKTKSKYMRPIIRVAQYDNEQEALQHYNKLTKNNN